MLAVERAGLRLGHLALPGRHDRRAQPFANEDPRVVEIEDLRPVVQRERGQREGQSPPAEQRGLQALRPETSELLDHSGHSARR